MDEKRRYSSKFYWKNGWLPKVSYEHIKAVSHVPQIGDAVYKFHGYVTDESFCDVVCEAAKNIDKNNPFYYEAIQAAAAVYEDVYGTPPDFLPLAELKLTEEQQRIIDIMDPMPMSMRLQVVRYRPFMRTVRRVGFPNDFLSSYYIFEQVFFKMIRLGFRTSKDENQKDWYLVFKKIANKYCYLIFDDSTVWRERLAAKIETC